MHGHPNADECHYSRDVGNVKKGLGLRRGRGDDGPVFLALVRALYYEEVLFSGWLAGTPPEVVTATFNLDPEIVAKFPKGRANVLPG
jgi:oxalate decarboxylase